MNPGDGDVTDAHLRLVAAAHLEDSVAGWLEQVDHTAGRLLEGQRLHQHVRQTFICRHIAADQVLDEVVTLTGARYKGQWVSMLTDLALELPPGPGDDSASALDLDLPAVALLSDPLAQAVEMDHFHASVALAGGDQRVGCIALVHPANFTRLLLVKGGIADRVQALVLVGPVTDFLPPVRLDRLDLELNAAQLEDVAHQNLVLAVTGVAVDVSDNDKHALLAKRVVLDDELALASFDDKHPRELI